MMASHGSGHDHNATNVWHSRQAAVEVVQRDHSIVAPLLIENAVNKLIRKDKYFHITRPITEFTDPFLTEHVESVRICFEDQDFFQVSSFKAEDFSPAQLPIRVFKLDRQGPQIEEIGTGEEGEEPTPAATHWVLPSAEFQGLWESLVYEANIKSDLMRFVRTSLLMSDRQVDSHLISYNRVVLLHGPPGTGKTSLCHALAQKLAIHLGHRYAHGQLIEINSHSLFSKWFSESGKLVQKMFTEIRDMIEEPGSFVCVLIDEVESLTAARRSSSSEPSDAVRVVNAVLTQLDSIRKYPNVLILTTSNITGAIDLAFVDRADIKQYIGPPSQNAIYNIYYTCISELQRTNILETAEEAALLPLDALLLRNKGDSSPPGGDALIQCSLQLWNIAGQSQGLSGRTLRKLPFLALARFADPSGGDLRLSDFFTALQMALTKQLSDREELRGGNEQAVAVKG